MTKYVSKHPKPTPYEREVLTIMIEECAEVIQAATKLLRFGANDGYPGTGRTNEDDLGKEIGDLQCMIDMARNLGLVNGDDIATASFNKSIKVREFMQEPKP